MIVDEAARYAAYADYWAALGPDGVRWAALALLTLVCFVAGAVVAILDPELLEIYIGEPQLLALTAAFALVALGTLITLGPTIAVGGLALH